MNPRYLPTIALAIVFVLTFLAGYAFLWFVTMDSNPSNWHGSLRLILATVSVVSTGLFYSRVIDQ